MLHTTSNPPFVSCLILLYLIIATFAFATVADNAGSNNVSCSAADLEALYLIAEELPALLFASNSSNCCGRWNNSVYVGCSGHRITKLTIALSMYETVAVSLFPIAVCRLSALSSLTLTGGLASALLSGSIPPCLASNLSNLVHLDLSFNSLAGPIPTAFPPDLQFLALTSNHFTDTIPAQAFPSSLQHLDLALNKLTGSIPLSISRLHSLSHLDLSSNYNISGAFPAIFFNGDIFPHLQELHLNENALSGPIPNTSFNTSNLTTLVLSFNSLSGPLPALNLPSLQILDVGSNLLSGDTSSFFASSTLPSLQYLQLSYNYLSGELGGFNPTFFSSITDIYLSHNALQGSFSPSLCRLPNLSSLSLSDNSLSGPLDFQHCNLSMLDFLDISGNQLSGPFPDELGSISTLTTLFLDDNYFNGSFPENWRNLAFLSSLGLSGNSLIPLNHHVPKLPSWLFNLTSLSTLLAGSLQLQGRDLGFCSSSSSSHGLALQDLDLSNNLLTSTDLACFSNANISISQNFNISRNPLRLELASNPNAIRAFSVLSNGALHLRSCMLAGSLTTLFVNQLANSTINYLYLGDNQLEGELVLDFGNMPKLVTLDLSFNNFTRVDLITSSKQISSLNLFLSNNFLEGNLSSMLTCDGLIGQIDLSHNLLIGSISPFIGQCFSSSTKRIKFNHNHLESFIPNELFAGNLVSLEILSLNNNQLSGHIPSSFTTLTGLVLLDLSHNKLEEILETSALFSHPSPEHYANLRVLNLGYNKFEGIVPTSLGIIAPDLQVIDLSNNQLIGTVPVQSFLSLRQFHLENQMHGLEINKGTLYEEINIVVKGNAETFQYVIQALTSLDLSNNELNGTIKRGMGELSGLVYLNLSRNSLWGPIPSDLGELGSQLQSLDLSFNEFVGSIPSSLQSLTQLAIFNISYNAGLSGPIPQNSPQLQNNNSYIGDFGLCGNPILSRSCPLVAAPNPYSQSKHYNKDATFLSRLARWFNEWIAIGGLALGWVVGFLGSLWILRCSSCCNGVSST